jgi:hypothetical protein
MEILRIGNWHVVVYSWWKNFHIEPTFDILTFYLHPEQWCFTIFNITIEISKHYWGK